MTPKDTPLSNNIFIKCPSCGKVLQFRAFPNYKKARLKCPFCHFDDLIENYTSLQSNVKTTKPDIPPMQDEDEATRTLDPVITIRCLSNNQSHQLRVGENTIGRSSATPQATVTFDDPNKFISRNHARITVIRTPGGSLQCRLSDNGSKNGTFIGKTRISNGTIVIVPAGQVFTLGRMQFVIDIQGDKSVMCSGDSSSSSPTELI